MRFFRIRRTSIIVCVIVFLLSCGKNAYSQEMTLPPTREDTKPPAQDSFTSVEKNSLNSLHILVEHRAVQAGKSSVVSDLDCVVKPYVVDDQETAVTTSTKMMYEDVVKDVSEKESFRDFSSSGKWSIRRCTNPDGSVTVDIFPVGVIDPYVLVAEAIETIAVGPPPVEISDTGLGAQITQRGTVLWVDETYWGAVRSETVSAGPVSVTVTLTPRFTSWDMGDGSFYDCGVNEPWDDDFSREPEEYECYHVYEMATGEDELYVISATARFEVSAVTNSGQVLPVPDLQATGTTETRVDEIQALIVPTPGQYGE